MFIRPKPFLNYFLICLTPLLLLGVMNYWHGLRTAKAAVSVDLQDNLNGYTREIDNVLRAQENELMRFALAPDTQQFVGARLAAKEGSPAGASPDSKSPNERRDSLPSDLQARISTLMEGHRYLKSLALFTRNRQPVLFADRAPNPKDARVVFHIYNFPPDQPKPDERVWDLQGNTLLRQPIQTDSAGMSLLYTVPIFSENGHSIAAAMVGELAVEPVFTQSARVLETKTDRDDSFNTKLIVLDSSGRVLYHTDETLKHQAVTSAMPSFRLIADAMVANKSGIQSFRSPAGQNYLVAFAPLPRLNLSVAVIRNTTQLLSNTHAMGVLGLFFSLVLAITAALLLDQYVQKRLRSIERVNEGLTAIAKGELNHRIEVQSTDDARGMADNINVVTERLRAQIAREAESRQFDSFVKLSALLTHDLKNAIETLSLIVGNMERHFDNERFRADAMKSLTSATDKLKALVARLSKPVTTLSGEHKRPQPTDLVPILKRVVALTAEPQRERHRIEMRLPPTLFALADGERIENVIENLVLNALEAMSERNGSLTIEAAQAEDGNVVVSVTDTGVGMTPQFIETRLFHPFATTKRLGVGLGLYTCREVMQANGGTIEVHSVEGAGTTFRLMLPSA